ncbi:MAG: hypothetical protein QM687_15560 [Ferruginibacter sp.]
MNQKNLSELTNEELLLQAKKMKSLNLFNAVLIGFLIGIVLYSVLQNSWGFLTLIPLYFAYRLINQSKYDREELNKVLKERNLQ